MHFPTHDELIAQIDAFLRRHAGRDPPLSERQIGIEVANDSALISSIRDGRSPRLKTLNKLADFMAAEDEKLTSISAPTEQAA